MNTKQPPKQLLFKYFLNNLTAVLRPDVLVWWFYIPLCFTFLLSCLGVFGAFSLVVIMCINKQAICSLRVFFPV